VSLLVILYYNASTLFKTRCLYAYAEIRTVNAATALTISVDERKKKGDKILYIYNIRKIKKKERS
jgi:hypothetical protein